jgi:hypothetical protein
MDVLWRGRDCSRQPYQRLRNRALVPQHSPAMPPSSPAIRYGKRCGLAAAEKTASVGTHTMRNAIHENQMEAERHAIRVSLRLMLALPRSQPAFSKRL